MTEDNRFKYHNHLATVVANDMLVTIDKDISYGASWKKRGGVGAYMMLARKWDRLEEMMQSQFGYDIFEGIAFDVTGEDGSILAEVRDLRRYLMLVEAEMVERLGLDMGHSLEEALKRFPHAKPVPVEDSNRHALQPMDEEEVASSKTGLEPYAITEEEYTLLPNEIADVYERVAPDRFVLQESIYKDEYDRYLQELSIQFRHKGYVPELYLVHNEHVILNRTHLIQVMGDRYAATGLLRTSMELNHKEWTMLTGYWPSLYVWNEGHSKWIMDEQFRWLWSK